MPDTKLYHGTIFLFDTETGERINVAVQIATSERRLAYTIRSLVSEGHAPITINSTDPEPCQLIRDLIEQMREVSVPA